MTPTPSDADLGAYYAGAYRPPWRPPRENRVAATFVHRLLEKIGVPDRSLLDFGAGAGVFAVEIRARGYAVAGLELADRDRQLANQRGIPTVRDLSELDGKEFGVILARHVIEHVPDPLSTLRSLRVRLRPGGVLLVGVPHFGSAAARLLGRGWEWYAPPAHLWYFDRRALTALGQRAGLEPVLSTTIQGDAAPLPLALAAGPSRSSMRRRAPEGYWRPTSGSPGGPSTRTSLRSLMAAAYLGVMHMAKRLWPWGDEELWMAFRAGDR